MQSRDTALFETFKATRNSSETPKTVSTVEVCIKSDMSTRDASKTSQMDDEVGYLFLKSCVVRLTPEGTASNDLSLPTGKILDVSFPLVSEDKEEVDEHERKCSAQSQGVCDRCDLVLSVTPTEGHSSLELSIRNPPRFSGNIVDSKVDRGKCCDQCQRNGSRSDAALMAGVAFSSQAYHHISIRRIQILLKNTHSSETKDRSSGALEAERPVALLITLAFPQLFGEASTAKSLRSIGTAPKGRVPKNLPSCTQLLLSVMRSDWQFLDKELDCLRRCCMGADRLADSVNELQYDGTLKKAPCTFFPSKLSLEELYVRIKSAQESESISQPTESNISCPMTSLPEDVLVDWVAPNLRARSLDALRCSCTFLQRSLQKVVPGMKLELCAHQIRSLDFMRKRECRALTEEDVLLRQESSLPVDVGGDLHRAVTGGATVWLRPRTPPSLSLLAPRTTRSVRVDQSNGRESEVGVRPVTQQSFFLSRRVARGGLMCDDPGLGKTITVLSLVLQTHGLTTEGPAASADSDLSADSKKARDRESIFKAYWHENVPRPFKRQLLSKLLSTVRKWTPESSFFEHDVDPVADGCPDYCDVIVRPMSFQQILRNMEEDESYVDDFEHWCSDVMLCFCNAIQYNPVDHAIHAAAKLMEDRFKETVKDFMEKQVNSALKSFRSSSSKPNSSVAAIIEKGRTQEVRSALLQSSGTLIVVPSTLLDHWEEQIKAHVDTRYCTNKTPLIFCFKGASDAVDDALEKCEKSNSLCPLVFIDRAGVKRLPPPNFLAMFHVVITTNKRLTHEWKKGSFENELKTRNSGASACSDVFDEASLKCRSIEACPLLKVYWLRLVVDEGHSMGRGTLSNSILFASWISARNRWAMTGTPTPQTSENSLKNLLGLFRFIQHDFFSKRLDGQSIWQQNILRSWKEGNVASFYRLQSLLALLMVRHTKLDIKELEPPRFRKVFLAMSKGEVTAYNTLVSAIQANLVLTSMKGETSGRQDSLLEPSQNKHARAAFRNLRLALSGGTRVVPTLEEKLWNETIAMLSSLGLEKVKISMVKNYLHRAVTEQLSGCMRCGLQLSTLLVMPCGDLVCTECTSSASRACPACGKPFAVDTVQRLQPGIDYQWHHNIEEKEKAKESRGAQAGQQSEQHDDGTAHQRLMRGLDPAGLMPMQPARSRRPTRRHGDGHICEYDPASTEGKCVHCSELHFHKGLCLFNEAGSRCSVCYRVSEPCPPAESKFFYITTKLEELRVTYARKAACDASPAASNILGEEVSSSGKRPLKIIVFSQYRSILNLLGHRLLNRFGSRCVAEFWGHSRSSELKKFITDPECFCMFLGKDGSEGLDLSFVTHIIFVEEVLDKAIESQVVARAWRMGAKGHVAVETLVSRNTVDEELAKLEQMLGSRSGSGDVLEGAEDASNKQFQRAKLVYLLKNLRLIRSGIPDHPPARKRDRGAAEVATGEIGHNCTQTKKRVRVRFDI